MGTLKTKNYGPKKLLVIHLSELSGTKFSAGKFASEMRAAKDLLDEDPNVPKDIARVYTLDTVKGCLSALFAGGARISSLRIFNNSSYILDDYERNPRRFTVPGWLKKNGKERVVVRDKIPEGF